MKQISNSKSPDGDLMAKFQSHLQSLCGETNNKKFLLAVSGGIDSVVMAHLFRDSGLHYGIAHCNFQLRGKESDEDLKFVKNLAKANSVRFYSVSFNIMEYVQKNKVSVQMAARDLRYNWFNEICKKENYDYLITAHHADDAIETFLINLLRGTGISGLRGINPVNGNIIRPMLVFSRKEIEAYAKEHKIKWREDRSNSSDDYERNNIRHHLIPALDKVKPGARNAILNTMEMLRSTEEIFNEHVKSETSKYLKKDKKKIEIELSLFKESSYPATYLFETIKEFGFNYEQCKMIAQVVKKKEHSGKSFFSKTHRLVIDRNSITVNHYKAENEIFYQISSNIIGIDNPLFMCWFDTIKRTKNYKPDTSKNIACIDFDKLSFPLEVRKWRKGDRFYPLGMKQFQKISDFLINNKVSVPDKEDVYVLTSNGEVVWLMGYRIDERFKITGATKKIYLCTLSNPIIHE